MAKSFIPLKHINEKKMQFNDNIIFLKEN